MLEKILKNILSSIAKADDAPMSAEVHILTAISLLLELVPDFKASTPEEEEIIDYAKEVCSSLKGNSNAS